MTETELQAIVQREVDKERRRLWRQILEREVKLSREYQKFMELAREIVNKSIGQPVEIDHDING